MRRWIVLAFAALLILPAAAGQHPAEITVAQLEQVLTASEAAHLADAVIAKQLVGMKLTERLSTASLTRLKTGLPGPESRQALVLLADASVFLDPPAAETPANSIPSPAALRKMLVAVVNYVNTTMRQLPNFLATRATTRFEDRPQEDLQGSTGMTTLAHEPLHVIGISTETVTYRDGHEVVEEPATKIKKSAKPVQELYTKGVFGPILSVVVGDALKGQITWGGWEEGTQGAEAVFHYTVPREKSHYAVNFCCVPTAIDALTGGPGGWQVFSEIPAYHGEIAFDPASGAILRITIQADMTPDEAVSRNGTMVEYGAVKIGETSYICPLRSVSLLQAYTELPPPGADPTARFRSPSQTFLNDSTYEQYHRFGSEVRILTGNSAEPAASSPAPANKVAAPASPQSR